MSDPKSPLKFEEGFVDIPISFEELFTLIRMLEYSSSAFDSLTQEAHIQNDTQLEAVFKARADLCKLFAQKFQAVAQVGTPADDSKH